MSTSRGLRFGIVAFACGAVSVAAQPQLEVVDEPDGEVQPAQSERVVEQREREAGEDPDGKVQPPQSELDTDESKPGVLGDPDGKVQPPQSELDTDESEPGVPGEPEGKVQPPQSELDTDESEPDVSGEPEGKVQPPQNRRVAIAAAILHPRRPAADRERDANRKPAAVLAFFGIAPGQTVFELFSGGGYYTELLARTLGEEGKVYAHNNEAWRRYVGDALSARYADERLANVERLDVEVDALELPEGGLDAAVMILAFHDTYWVVEDGSWPEMDPGALLAEIMRGLKPGGVLGVIDHAAEPGSGSAHVGEKHRIDEDFVKREILAAGFVFDGASDLLRNPQDDHSLAMTDDAIRGRTDRFVYRFRKPG